MYEATEMMIVVGALLVMVFSGVHIAISLGLTSMLGIYLLTGDMHAMISFVSNTSYEALRDYIFVQRVIYLLSLTAQ